MIRSDLWFIGDKHSREFSEAVEMLRRRTRCEWSPDVEAAVLRIDDDFSPPDIVVIAQSRPGQFSDRQIDRLHRALPLVRFLALLGSLCEGEARTGRPWPGIARIYWHQWAPRFARELQRLADGKCPAWGLPLTATADETMEFAAQGPSTPRQGLLAIRARLGSTYDTLAAACRSAGYATVWLRDDQHVQVEGSVAAVWDDSHCGDRQAAGIKRLAESVAPAPVVAMFHFPRVEDRDRALAAGASAVLSKPLLLDDLFWHLDRLSGDSALHGEPQGPSTS